MLARRFSIICFFTALIGIYAAIQAAGIETTQRPASKCRVDQVLPCEKP